MMGRLFQNKNDDGFVAHEISAVDRLGDEEGGANNDLSGFKIMPFSEHGRLNHVLLVTQDLVARVNGQPVVGFLHQLRHKDEISIDSQQFVFSAESTPEVVVYHQEEPGKSLRCPVCRGPILDGQDVVHCPGCQRIYHEIGAASTGAGKPCWTYRANCTFCGHGTSLSEDASWRPEEETE